MSIEKISNTDEDKTLIEGSEEGAMIIVVIEKINEIIDWINAQ